MHQTKLSIQDRHAIADTDKKEYLQQIDAYTDNIIKHARDLKKAAVTCVDAYHKKTTNGMQSEMKSVDDITEQMERRLNNLNGTHNTNASQTFVDIKQGEKEVKDAKQLEESLKSSGLEQVKTKFILDDSVDTFLNVDYLGKVITTKPYKAVLKGQYSVEVKTGESNCLITDACMLSNGTLLMADYAYACIKIMDNSNKVSKRFKLPSKPWGICRTSQDEIAITLTGDRKVQFVNVTGKWKLTRSFNVENGCRGITHSNDQLLVSCGGNPGDSKWDPEGPGFVGIYDMSGTILRKIQVDLHGRQIFSFPRQISTTGDGSKIHIADQKGGLVTVDRRGNVLSRFTENLKWAYGVCAVSDYGLIVCGVDSDNVLQIDTSGNVVAELLSIRDGIVRPISVSYLRDSQRLMVALWNTNNIKIFDLVL